MKGRVGEENGNRDFDFDGTASFIWLKRDGQWKLTYATVVTQPVSN
jgi:hypothetical protein